MTKKWMDNQLLIDWLTYWLIFDEEKNIKILVVYIISIWLIWEESLLKS